MHKSRLPKVCFVSTLAWPLRVYLSPHLRRISSETELTLVADKVSELNKHNLPSDIYLKNIKISRKINLLEDLISLFLLFQFFKNKKFRCVHSIMPKAGLLSMLAAWLAGVPIRVHTFTGQVWATRHGASRFLLLFLDYLTASLATHVLADSPSQRQFLIQHGVVKANKIVVLGFGSICVVDLNRFQPYFNDRKQVRSDLGINESDLVLIFVGRLNPEKGVNDLILAFRALSVEFPNLKLLIVGPDEFGYDLQLANLDANIRNKICKIQFTDVPEKYMNAADIICLPSYREGFGSVLIEAAAVGLPAVASRIYGITDAVIDGVTGLLHEPGNNLSLTQALAKIIQDDFFRLYLSQEARARAISKFSEDSISFKFESFYRRIGVI